MNILYAADDNYAWLAGVSLLSFLDNNKYENHRIFILDDDISQDNKKTLIDMCSQYQCELNFVDISEYMNLMRENNATGYGPTGCTQMTVFGRLFVASLLPEEIDRILYLDCDTIVLKNISGAYYEKMDSPIEMCPDCIYSSYKKTIGMKENDRYYNSGVMKMDLIKWRELGCEEAFLNHIKNVRSSYILPDQDSINVALGEFIRPFKTAGMNCQSQLFLYRYSGHKWVYKLTKENWIDKDFFKKTVKDPMIVHYCGNTFIRPWFTNSHHPYKKEWEKYHDKSPWKDINKGVFNSIYPYKIQYFMYRFFPKCVAALFGGVMQRIYYKKFHNI